MLDRFWRLLGRSWPVNLPRAPLRAKIGPEPALTWVESSGVAVVTPLIAGASYPCQSGGPPGCAMRLMAEDGTLYAICALPRAECEDIQIAAADAFQIEVSNPTLTPFIQRALHLEQRWVAENGVVRLGRRRFGRRSVDFVLVPRPDEEPARTWLRFAAALDPDRRYAIIVFHRENLPAAPPPTPHIAWMALSDSIPGPRGLQLPLGDILLQLVPDALDGTMLWPPYLFVVDPTGAHVWYAGQPLELLEPARLLLLALLDQPGQRVSREDLLRLVFPAEYSRSGTDPRDLEPRLRRAKLALSRALRAAGAAAGVSHDPIDTRRSRSESESGYRLAVAPGSVHRLRRADRADL